MLLDALRLTCLHLAWLLGPLVLAALVLHQLNVLTTRVLGSTFGAGAVVWFTGWLGTPVHELSHAAACVLFRHRIQELVLFRPDPASGVVGYVRYVWSPRNPWALLGHGIVGIAPLFGGASVLAVLLWLLAPGELVRSLFQFELAQDPAALTAQLGAWLPRLQAGALSLMQPSLWTHPTTWVFAYLTLCVGTHLAPSGADLKGAWPSLVLLLVLLALVDLTLVLSLDGAGTHWVMAAASLMVPVAALFSLAALLVAASLVGVLLLATLWSTLTGRGLLTPTRTLLSEPWRLAAVGAVGLLAAQLL